jgi:hypothetical protein
MGDQNSLFDGIELDWGTVPRTATVHDILADKGGRRGAMAFATLTAAQPGRRAPIDLLAGHRGPRILEVAADTAETEGSALAIRTVATTVFSGWCVVGLPYREPKGANPHVWRTDTDYATVVVESGSRALDDGRVEPIGVPFGAYARVINITLQHLAREQGRNIELGRSGNDVVRTLGLPRGGRVASNVLNQLERLVSCRVQFRKGSDQRGFVLNDRLVEAFEYDSDGDRFIKRLRLSQAYYDAIRNQPVTIDRGAVTSIRNSPMALDCYLFLCYRLPFLERELPISWTALWRQFGHGISAIKHFKMPFAESMEMARGVYPKALFAFNEKGVVLRPSTPPAFLVGKVRPLAK